MENEIQEQNLYSVKISRKVENIENKCNGTVKDKVKVARQFQEICIHTRKHEEIKKEKEQD